MRHDEPDLRWGARLGLAAVLVEWVGFHWDIAWHMDVGRDGFLTPPHLFILAGMYGAAAVAVVSMYRSARHGVRRPGLQLLGVSALGALVTLGVDNWFHLQFGVDVEMWSPPHILLGLTFMVGLVGVMIDHAGSRRPSAPATAAMAGAFLAVSTLSLAEYDFGTPHHRILWSPVVLGLLAGFAFALAHAASQHRWAATIAAGAFLALRLGALGFNAAMGRSLPVLPMGVLAGGLAFDLARGGRHRRGLAAWMTMFVVQVMWLQLIGKTWWTTAILLPGLALGAAAALVGASVGTGVGAPIAIAARRPHRYVPTRPRRGRVLVGTIVLVTVIAAMSGWGQTVGRGELVAASYAVQGDQVRLTIDGAGPSDWVSVFGPRHRLGLFDEQQKPGRYLTKLGMLVVPPEVQGDRLRALRRLPEDHDFSWLGGLDWHDGAFEGRVDGDGEFVVVWYVHEEHSSQAVLERGTSGPVVLARHASAPAEPPEPWEAPAATAVVMALAALLVLCAGSDLRAGARQAASTRATHGPRTARRRIRAPLESWYLEAHPRATAGVEACRYLERRPDEWFTHAELKAALGCSDRIIRERLPEALNRGTSTLLEIDKSQRAWRYRYTPR